jgi:hypothetical protein
MDLGVAGRKQTKLQIACAGTATVIKAKGITRLMLGVPFYECSWLTNPVASPAGYSVKFTDQALTAIQQKYSVT